MPDTELKSETDFRDLIKKPQKLFGYSYLYFLGALLLLGMLYVWNLSVIGKNAVPPAVLKDSTAFVQDIPLQSPSVLPPVDIMKVGVPSDSLIARGRDLFLANCSSCHGEKGMGDGPAAGTLNPKARNLQSLQGWINGSKVSQIYKTLEEGIAGSAMASHSYMLPGDRLALAHYVRTFALGQPVDTPQDLQGLDATYQLSRGRNTPGQIPIKRAVQLVSNEAMQEEMKFSRMATKVTASANAPGARVLNRVAYDVRKVLVSVGTRRGGVPTEVDFVRMAIGESKNMGFKAGVVLLSNQEWSEMYAYVRDLVTEG